MKILCDVCGGELEMSAGGNSATCKQCGMPHSLERVREKLGVSVNPQVDTTSSEKEKEAPIEDAIIEINDIEVIEEDVIDIDDIEVVEEDVIDIDDIEVIEEDATLSAAYYLADIPEEELAKLEGRVGNYFLNKDGETFAYNLPMAGEHTPTQEHYRTDSTTLKSTRSHRRGAA